MLCSAAAILSHEYDDDDDNDGDGLAEWLDEVIRMMAWKCGKIFLCILWFLIFLFLHPIFAFVSPYVFPSKINENVLVLWAILNRRWC